LVKHHGFYGKRSADFNAGRELLNPMSQIGFQVPCFIPVTEDGRSPPVSEHKKEKILDFHRNHLSLASPALDKS